MKTAIGFTWVGFLLASLSFGCDVESTEESEAPRHPLGKADVLGQCADQGSGDACGGKSAGNCWCDDSCAAYGDCCSDYDATCTEEPGSSEGDATEGGVGTCADEQTCIDDDGCCPAACTIAQDGDCGAVCTPYTHETVPNCYSLIRSFGISADDEQGALFPCIVYDGQGGSSFRMAGGTAISPYPFERARYERAEQGAMPHTAVLWSDASEFALYYTSADARTWQESTLRPPGREAKIWDMRAVPDRTTGAPAFLARYSTYDVRTRWYFRSVESDTFESTPISPYTRVAAVADEGHVYAVTPSGLFHERSASGVWETTGFGQTGFPAIDVEDGSVYIAWVRPQGAVQLSTRTSPESEWTTEVLATNATDSPFEGKIDIDVRGEITLVAYIQDDNQRITALRRRAQQDWTTWSVVPAPNGHLADLRVALTPSGTSHVVYMPTLGTNKPSRIATQAACD